MVFVSTFLNFCKDSIVNDRSRLLPQYFHVKWLFIEDYKQIANNLINQIKSFQFIISQTSKQQVINMGGCQSTDNTEIPKFSPTVLQNKFKTLQKHKFNIPLKLNAKPQILTSNGKISDYITKLQDFPIPLKYQQIDVGTNLGSDNKFQDKQFKPCNESIGKQHPAQNVQWKRPQKFMKGQISVFQGIIEPLDIKQGRLGNCYLLSAIASISEYPFIVKRIFQTTQLSTYGLYGVWLFIDGIWTCVVIDDFIPTFNNKAYYSNTHKNQLWVMLIEKAYAKTFKGYKNIQSGLTGIGLNVLTGAPYQYLCKDSKQKIDIETAWNFLVLNIGQNHLVVGSTENNDRNQYLGLISEHAYSILDVQEVHIATKKGKKKQRIIKLQNPWGKYEWKGRWSEYSDVWSQQLRQQLHFQKADDGIFWISIEDFVQNFGQLCACKYNKNYISTSLPLKFPEDDQIGYKGIFINSLTRTQGYLTLIQTDHRRFIDTTYQYSPVRLIVLKIDRTTKELSRYLNDIIDCDRDATIKLQLEPGDYFVFVEIDWKCNFTRNAVLNFYGQHPIGMVQDQQKIDVSGLFNQVVFLHQKFTQKQRIYKYAKDESIMRITGSIAGYVYYHYSNKSSTNNYLCQNVALKQRKFIEVYGQISKEQFTVKVYPDEERIVIMRVTKDGNSFYSFSTKILFYILEKYSLEKLKQLADKKPTKVKKRQIDGKQIDVRIKTYNYSGGIVLLYQNKMDKYAYVEEITFQIDNLELQNQIMPKNNKLEIQLEPQTEKMLSFVVSSPGKQIVFRTKIIFYLNSPEFKF